MAQFIYEGEPARQWVKAYGPMVELRVPQNSGSTIVLKNPTGFPIGEVIPYDFTDERSLKVMRADPRFKEVERG